MNLYSHILCRVQIVRKAKLTQDRARHLVIAPPNIFLPYLDALRAKFRKIGDGYRLKVMK